MLCIRRKLVNVFFLVKRALSMRGLARRGWTVLALSAPRVSIAVRLVKLASYGLLPRQ